MKLPLACSVRFRAAALVVSFGWAFLGRVAAGVDTWTWRNPFFGQYATGVVHGDSGWVMVGDHGATAVSADGNTWTTGTAGATYLSAITFGAGKYEALAADGTIRSSTDGQYWSVTRSAGGLNGTAIGIAFGGGTLVFISDAGDVLTSPDGTTWGSQRLTVSEPTLALRGIGYGNGLFVIVGSTGGTNALIFTSPDGHAWTRQAQSLTTASAGFGPTDRLNLFGVAYGNGHYVAVGDSDVVLVSMDGVAWARNVVPHAQTRSNTLRSVAFGNGAFVVGIPTSAYGLVSSDTVNWDEHPLPTGSRTFAVNALASDGTTFVAGDTVGQIATKIGDAEWTVVTKASVSDAPIAYGNGRFVMTGYGAFSTSSDAANWVTHQTDSSSHGPIAFGNGTFVTNGAANSLPATYTSPDGLTWTAHPGAPNFAALLFTRGRFFAASYNYLASSPDGVTWTAATVPETVVYHALAHGNGTLVAVGWIDSRSAVATSTDGVTWVARSGPASPLNGVAFGAGRFVATANSGIAMWTSADGITWTAVTLPSAPTGGYMGSGIGSIAYAAGTFVASVGSDLLTSTDGLSWTVMPRVFGSSSSGFQLAYGNGSFVAVGNGRVYQSAPDASAIVLTAATNSVIAAAGSTATLSVTATGAGLTYQWYSGASGDTSAPIAGATASGYTVSNVAAAGTYWARVSNGTTFVDGPTLALALAQVPLVTQQPANVDLFSGTTAVVSTSISGIPPPTLRWYAGASGDTAQPVNGGTYSSVSVPGVIRPTRVWARASNPSGTVDTDAALATPWTLRSANVPALQLLFANQTYVAVDHSITTSSDGVNWTRRYTPPSGQGGVDRVAYGNGVFVAIGTENKLMSSDGVTWTAEASPGGSFGYDWLCFGAGKFFTHDSTGYVTSADGVNWTAWTPPGGGGIEAMVFASGRLVALTNTEAVYTSADGVSWTQATVPWSTASGWWDDTLSVANGRVFGQVMGRLYSSVDGQAWTDAGLSVGQLTTVAYGNGVYVVGRQNSATLYRSTDGVTWSAVALAPQQNATTVLFAGGRFLTGGPSGFIYGSSDGQTWTAVVAWPGAPIAGLAYGNGRWVAAGAPIYPAPQGVGYYSVDTDKWIPIAAAPAFQSRPLFASGHFLAASAKGGVIVTSDDGASWTEEQVSGGTRSYTVLVHGSDRVVALGSNETATSTDGGATWTAAVSNLGYATAAVYGNGRFVAYGPGIWYSPDGIVWQQSNVGMYGSPALYALAYGAGTFVAVGDYGEIMTSTDGATWAGISMGLSGKFTDVIYAGGRFIATSTEAYYTSTDGQAWARSQFLVPVPAGVIAYGAGTFISAAFPTVLQSAPDTAEITVTQQPAPQAVASGASATFTVTAASTLSSSYQWLKDGVAIAGATDASLTFASVQPVDAGTYQARITNAGGGSALSQSAELIVDPAAPAITTAPTAVAINVGAATTLTVTASGNPAPRYQWSKDGTPIPGATNATLTFTAAKTTDAGGYTVTATNQFGSVSSTAVRISVATLTISADTPPIVGHSTTLSVDAVPGATFQWRYKGTPLSGATNATLTLDNLSRAQNGYYDVVLTYPTGAVTAFAYPLDVALVSMPEFYSADPAYAPRLEQDGAGGILCAVPVTGGKFLVGGDFTSLDATPRTYLARLNADGTLDTSYTPPALTGPVRAMALMSDGRIILGGDFMYAGGRRVGRLARLNADLTLDGAYGSGGGFNDTVYAVAGQPDGSVVVAGAFWVVGNGGRDRIARLDVNGSLDLKFATSGDTFPYGTGPGRVLLPLSNGQWMFGGGHFSDGHNGQGGFLIRLNADGSRDATFSAGPFDANGPVLALLAQSDGKIVAAGGGGFQTVPGNYVFRFTTTGAVDPTFTFDTSLVPNGGWVDQLIDGGAGRLLIAGSGVPLTRLAAGGGRDTTLPALSYATGTITQLSAETGGVRLWGRFQKAAGDPVTTGFVLLSSTDSLSVPVGCAPRAAAPVYDVVPLARGKMLIRGGFTEVNGTAQSGLAELSADGTLDSTFVPGVPITTADTGPVVVRGDGTILVHDGTKLQRLRSDGSVDPTFTPVAYLASALALDRNGQAVVASRSIGGVFPTSNGVLRILDDGAIDPAFGPVAVTGSVSYITVANDGQFRLWGGFGSINGRSVVTPAYLTADGQPEFNNWSVTYSNTVPVATAVDGTDWLADWLNAVSWSPPGPTAPALFQAQAALPLPDGGVVAAAPASIYNTPAGFLTRYDSTGKQDAAFRTDGMDYQGSVIGQMRLLEDGSIIVSGAALSAFASPRYGLMRLAPATAPTIQAQPVTATADVGGAATFSVTASGTGTLSYQWCWNGMAIPGATTSSLTVPNLQPSQVGTFTVQVGNTFGTVTSDAVTIHGPNPAPAITTQPQSQTGVAGSPVTFSVSATGVGPLAYRWRYSGYLLPGATQSTLTLGPLSRANAGLYDVVVSDGLTVTTSTSVKLDVAPRAYPNALALDPTFATALEKPGGVISAIVPGPARQYYISGDFSRLGGVARPGLARVDTAFTVDPTFVPPPELALGNEPYGNVTTVAAVLPDGNILVRQPLSVDTGNASHSTVVRLLPSGAVDGTFSAAGAVQEVARLAVQPDGKLIVIGRLTTGSGATNQTVFRLNADGSVDTSYAPAFTASGQPAQPAAVAVQASGAAVFAGSFGAVNGTGVTGALVRLTSTGAIDPAFHVTGVTLTSASTVAIAPDGTLVVDGYFSDGTGTGAVLVRLGADGAYQRSLLSASDAPDGVWTVKLQADGKIFATTWNSFLRIRRISASGTLERTFDGYQPRPWAQAFAPDGGDGLLAAFGSVTDPGAAAVHLAADGTTASTAAFEIATGAQAIVPADAGKFYIGGDFTRINGEPARNVARLKSDGSIDPSFSSGTGTNQPVSHLLHLPDGGVAISGSFSTYDGVSVSPVAELRADGSLNPRFVVAPTTNAALYEGQLALLADARVLAAGRTAFHFDGSVDPTYAPTSGATPLSGVVQAVPLPGGDVVVRGNSTVSGAYVARLGPEGALAAFASGGLLRISDIGADPAGRILLAGAVQSGPYLLVPAVRRMTAALGPDSTFAATAYPANGTSSYPGPGLLVQEDGRVIVNDSRGLSRLKPDGNPDGAFVPVPLTIAYDRTPRPASALLFEDDGALLISDSGLNVGGYLLRGVFRLVDPAALQLAQQPQSQAVTLGEAATFSVSPAGTGPFTYQWLKNGAAIAGATSATYTIATAAYEDAGAYAVVVTNSNGPVQSVAGWLVVKPPVAPVITAQPRPQSGGAGAAVAFSVKATGAPAPVYQWRKDGVAIGGATNATFAIAAIAPADAGKYSVAVSNVAGTVVSDDAALVVLPTGMSATHQVTAATVGANATVTITNTFTYAGAAPALTWSVVLPDGWSVAASSGDDAAATKPAVGTTSVATWSWTSAPLSPVTFTYTLAAPAGATGTEQVAALVSVGAGPDVQFLAHPDPLLLAFRHAADENGDWKISLLELTRVIELYNTRNGAGRTGCYAVQEGSEDGFAPDFGRLNTATVTLSRYHSADTNQDGKISLFELTRVIELYNYRNGPTRTGQYHVQPGTEDGFAPGP